MFPLLFLKGYNNIVEKKTFKRRFYLLCRTGNLKMKLLVTGAAGHRLPLRRLDSRGCCGRFPGDGVQSKCAGDPEHSKSL